MTGSPASGATPAGRESYPVRVDAVLEPRLSRGLWLVKWVLLIPHLVVLTFLWIAFSLVSVIAFFAIPFTSRDQRPGVGGRRATSRRDGPGHAGSRTGHGAG